MEVFCAPEFGSPNFHRTLVAEYPEAVHPMLNVREGGAVKEAVWQLRVNEKGWGVGLPNTFTKLGNPIAEVFGATVWPWSTKPQPEPMTFGLLMTLKYCAPLFAI